MIRVSVMYPNEKGKRFDLEYYVHQHMGLCRKLMGPAVLVKAEVDKAADPNAPFVCIGHLYFKTMEDFQNGFFPHAGDLAADVAKCTDITPQLQISEIV